MSKHEVWCSKSLDDCSREELMEIIIKMNKQPGNYISNGMDLLRSMRIYKQKYKGA
jgi:hypothetical protein